MQPNTPETTAPPTPDINSSEQSYPEIQPVNPSAPPVLPKKKSKKKLVILLSVIAVLILGVTSAVVVYAFVYNNPDRAFDDAMAKALSAKSGEMDATMKMKTYLDYSIDMTYKVSYNESGQYSGNVSYSADMYGTTIPFKADFAGGAGEAYVRLDIKDLFNALTNSGTTVYGSYLSGIVGKINDNWILIKDSDLDELSGGSVSDEVSTCMQNEVDKIGSDASARTKLMSLYQNNRFITVTHVGADEDGTKYQLGYDKEKAKSFAQALKDTDYFKALDNCTEDDLAAQVDSFDPAGTGDEQPTVNVWIDSWTHTLNKISLSAEDDTSTMDIEMRVKFNTNPTVTIPSDYMTVDELKTEIEKVQDEFSKSFYDTYSTTNALNSNVY